MAISIKYAKKVEKIGNVKLLFADDFKKEKIDGFNLKKIFKGEEFKGKLFDFFLIKIGDRNGYFILIGLGERDKFNGERAFKIGSFLTLKLKELELSSVNISTEIFDRDENLLYEFFSGIFYGDYENNFFKSDKKDRNISIYINNSVGEKRFRKLLDITKSIGNSVNLCREYVDLPANYINPITFSDRVRKMFKGSDVKVDILNLKEIEKNGLNLIKAVSSGSFNEPRLLILEYKNSKKSPVALVGKGVTFDSGGLNLKPTNYIEDMKTDMAGGAVVISTIKLLSDLKEKVNVVGIIPLVENLPGKNAIKPGDVFISHSGKSVEVLNTDAEGRLILADGISYSKKFEPSVIIDLATLTGSAVVALGTLRCALFTKEEKLREKFWRIGDKIGEKVWPMPFDDEYGEELKSDIADLKNISGSKYGGAITAAKFLENFAEGFPFVHLDIAGVVDLKSKKNYAIKGATGFGVRLLYNFFREVD